MPKKPLRPGPARAKDTRSGDGVATISETPCMVDKGLRGNIITTFASVEELYDHFASADAAGWDSL